ncbi:MAG: CBS domain-containing protein [Proteobacteria bacterium]|nr:CBS domain-containing protein [Pseudomonadota bacterium]
MKIPETVSIATMKDIITIDIDEGVDTALTLMKENRIRHLPVTNDDEIVGMLTTRDISRALLPQSRFKDWKHITDEDLRNNICAGELMNWPIAALPLKSDLAFITDYMIDHKLSAIILTHDDGRVAGILSHEDLLHALAEILKHPEQPLREKIKEWFSKSSIGDFIKPLSDSGI